MRILESPMFAGVFSGFGRLLGYFVPAIVCSRGKPGIHGGSVGADASARRPYLCYECETGWQPIRKVGGGVNGTPHVTVG